jgi:hypothetical protein
MWTGTWAVVGVGLWWWCQPASRPTWVDDIVLRAYASDHLVDPGTTPEQQALFEEASTVGAEYGLPTAWVLWLQQQGVKPQQLDEAANEVVAQMVEVGPPENQLPPTLAQYRDRVLRAAGNVTKAVKVS